MQPFGAGRALLAVGCIPSSKILALCCVGKVLFHIDPLASTLTYERGDPGFAVTNDVSQKSGSVYATCQLTSQVVQMKWDFSTAGKMQKAYAKKSDSASEVTISFKMYYIELGIQNIGKYAQKLRPGSGCRIVSGLGGNGRLDEISCG